MIIEKPARQRALERWSALKAERSSWDSSWTTISRYFNPYNARFGGSLPNKGSRQDQLILDNTPMLARNVLVAGMIAGLSNQSLPWFTFTLEDTELADSHAVKEWLSDVTELARTVFARSNAYRGLARSYNDQAVYGTYAGLIEPDFENVMHEHSLVPGEYAIACDDKGRVNTIYRQFKMTVENIVRRYGLERCSNHVRNAYGNGNYDAKYDLLHWIEPNRSRDVRSKLSGDKRWKSCTIELSDGTDKLLRQSGFDDYPGVCPRWENYDGDDYGRSPGWLALGDAIQLQKEQQDKGTAIAFQANPPWAVPASFKNTMDIIRPGAAIPVNGNEKITSAFDVPLRIDHLQLDIQDVRQRINEAFHVPLFQALLAGRRPSMTAREVAEIASEKVMMAGPMLEQQHRENLSVRVELCFMYMLRAGMLPPPPPELEGAELKIEFVSMLAQAQRMQDVNAIERWSGTLGQLAQVKPDVLDNWDSDFTVQALADAYGVDPEHVRPSDKVALIRQEKAQQQMQQQQLEQQAMQAQTAQALSKADLGGNNALAAMTNG